MINDNNNNLLLLHIFRTRLIEKWIKYLKLGAGKITRAFFTNII